MSSPTPSRLERIRQRIGHIIFETNTPASNLFDMLLIWFILASILLVMLESVGSFQHRYGALLRALEWCFTLVFTLEYVARVWTSLNTRRYVLSFFGIIDLLTILPSYLSIFFTGAHYLLVIRALRLLRVFRVLKLVRFLDEANTLSRALQASRAKITVFLGVVMTLVVIIGALIYMVEGEDNGFTNIPISIYWAIVTLTTVGYGDISPQTPLGRILASLIMVIGYGIIAVPTGIVTAEIANVQEGGPANKGYRLCSICHPSDHPKGALFCHLCGGEVKVTDKDVLCRHSQITDLKHLKEIHDN